MKKKTGKNGNKKPAFDNDGDEMGMGMPMLARKPMAKGKGAKAKSANGLRRV